MERYGLKQILIIVESPAKCKIIEKYLGPGYKCIATCGHIRELPCLKNVDVNNRFTPNFVKLKDKSAVIAKIKSAIANTDMVILATDDDREGETIAWHICDYFKLPLTTPRIIFHEITESALKTAILQPTIIDMNLVYAQHSRQILDLIVGFTITPFLWKHISNNPKLKLSAGRCQTPALRLVYENEVESRNKIQTGHYNITGLFTNRSIPFKFNTHFTTPNEVDKFLGGCDKNDWYCILANNEPHCYRPPEPFTTASLQQMASSQLNMSPFETMSNAQILYEHGYITYMRTDCAKYSAEAIKNISEYIELTYLPKSLNNDLDFITLGDSTKGAHEAIRPTNINLLKIETNTTLTKWVQKLYELIWRNTVQSCMTWYENQVLTIDIYANKKTDLIYTEQNGRLTIKGEYEYLENRRVFNLDGSYVCKYEDNYFRYSTFNCTNAGWYQVGNHKMSCDYFRYLSNILSESDEFNFKSPVICHKINANWEQFGFKSHISEAKLVKLLNDKDIGRPSTFSSLVKKIKDRNYVEKKDIRAIEISCINYEYIPNTSIIEMEQLCLFGGETGKLVISPLGEIVTEFLMKYFNEIFNYEFTSNMEKQLDQISKGELDWTIPCQTIYDMIENIGIDIDTIDKFSIDLSDGYEYIVGKSGPIIKYTNTETKDVKFISVKPNINLIQIKNKQLSIIDLVDKIPEFVCNDEIKIKSGEFGVYAQIGNLRKKLDINKSEIDNLTEVSAKALIENASGIKRIINNEISIREGKGNYSDYIFIKTKIMKKPKFISLEKFKGDYMNCTFDELNVYINKNDDIPKKKIFYKKK